jgi:hypothetical protein
MARRPAPSFCRWAALTAIAVFVAHRTIVIQDVGRPAFAVAPAAHAVDSDHAPRSPLCAGGHGVLLFAMSESTAAAQLLDASLRSAESFRLAGYSGAIGLVTDFDLTHEQERAFTCVVRATVAHARPTGTNAAQQQPQWHNAWQLRLTPFDETLVVAHSFVACANLTPSVWEALGTYDVLTPYAENDLPLWSALYLRRGPGLGAFLQTLEALLPLASFELAVDTALRATPERTNGQPFTGGVLPPTWAATLSSVRAAPSIHISMVLSGPVYLLPLGLSVSLQAVGRQCAYHSAANGRTVPRVYIYDSAHKLSHVATTAPQCAKLTGNNCEHLNDHWPLGAPMIPISMYLPGHRTADRARMRPVPPGLTYGVVYYGYSSDALRAARYVANIESAAWGLLRHNPGIGIALVTNIEYPVRPPFTHVVRIREEDMAATNSSALLRRGATWNILPKVRYHRKSPFDVTVQLDSDRVVCRDIGRLFELLTQWDLLSTSAGVLPTFDHGVLGFRLTAGMHALLDAWATAMLDMHLETKDEQAPLVKVRDSNPQLRVGYLDPVWQMKYMPANNAGGDFCEESPQSCNITHTLVMHGPVHITVGAGSLDEQDHICRYANLNADSARIFVHDRATRHYFPVFSQEECDTKTYTQCRHTELSWLPYPEVSSVRDYLSAHYRPPA